TMKMEKDIRWVLTPKLPEMEKFPEHLQIRDHKGTFVWVRDMTKDPTEQQPE
ncbi:hypothetical protein AX16_010472, partial [Volvariella volvacea WC 439]